MADSKYKQALEALKDDYKHNANITSQGRMLYNLYLIYEVALTIKAFDTLAETMKKDESVWMDDVDVDYIFWSKMRTWDGIPNKEARAVTILKVELEEREKMINVIDMANSSKVRYSADVIAANDNDNKEFESVIDDVEKMHKSSAIIDAKMSIMLDRLKCKLSDIENNLSNSINIRKCASFAENRKDYYVENNQITIDIVEDFQSKMRDAEIQNWEEERVNEEIQTQIIKYIKIDFIKDRTIELSKNKRDDEVTKFKKRFAFDDENEPSRDDCLKYMTLCDDNYDIDAGRVGRYLFRNRFKFNNNPNKVAEFMGFWAVMCLLSKQLNDLQSSNRRNIIELSDEEILATIDSVLGKIPEDYFNEGYSVERVKRFYKKLLSEDIEERYKKDREEVWKKFRSVTEEDNKIAKVPFMLILGRLEVKKWLKESSKNISFVNLIAEMFGVSEDSFVKNMRQYRNAGKRKDLKRWPENVYDFIDNIIDRAFE